MIPLEILDLILFKRLMERKVVDISGVDKRKSLASAL